MNTPRTRVTAPDKSRAESAVSEPGRPPWQDHPGTAFGPAVAGRPFRGRRYGQPDRSSALRLPSTGSGAVLDPQTRTRRESIEGGSTVCDKLKPRVHREDLAEVRPERGRPGWGADAIADFRSAVRRTDGGHTQRSTLMILIVLVSPALANGQASEPPSKVSVFGFDRMGAGAPAGWRVTGETYTWESEDKSGPLGAGAARIRLGRKGRLSIDSPAHFMASGTDHALSLWLRSEPAGAIVRVEIRDNDGEERAFLKREVAAGETWQRTTVKGTLPKSLKERYYLRLEASGENRTLWLDGLWFGPHDGPTDETWRPAVYPAGVVLKPQAPWGLVNGNEPMRVDATVVGAVREDARLRLKVVHTDGGVAELPPVEIDASGIWRRTIDISGDIAQPYGMLRVEATVVDSKGGAISPLGETLLARAPQPIPGPLPASPFGVHVSLRESDVSVAARLGYKWCRIHDASGITKWGYAEPERGKWVWFDDQVDLVRRHGLCILGMLDGSPPWESGTTRGGYWSIYGAPRSIDNWRHYVRQVVGHYAGRIDHWEVWNEPWNPMGFFENGSPLLYTKLLKAAYEEAKKTNPRCTVVGIDTYPPIWDRLVLGLGAYPYYDVFSWHRYDPGLHGRPDDAIARYTERLRREQARYGKPKPILCSEGGPDVTIFHGSFFSFADPVLSGDWSRAADAYARWFLSAVAAGNQRFIAYSIHSEPRYGLSTHMMFEPGFLLRPMHLALSALASFVEGAGYESRLTPAHDISAHVFRQPNRRPYAEGPSTVVVLIADGNDPEDLPRPLPAGIQSYDRWGNAIRIPTQATRSPVYLVAGGDAAPRLLDALRGAPAASTAAPSGNRATIDALLDDTAASLTHGAPPLWSLLSTQGSVVVLGSRDGHAVARRGTLKSDGSLSRRFRLPAGTRIAERSSARNGELMFGSFELAGSQSSGAADRWTALFAAVPDGPGASWRYASLVIVPAGLEATPSEISGASDLIESLEEAVRTSHVLSLRPRLYPEPFCMALCKSDGESYWFTHPEHFITMLNQISLWGGISRSKMADLRLMAGADAVAISGRWEIASPFFGHAPHSFTATLLRTSEGWKLVALCMSAGPT